VVGNSAAFAEIDLLGDIVVICTVNPSQHTSLSLTLVALGCMRLACSEMRTDKAEARLVHSQTNSNTTLVARLAASTSFAHIHRNVRAAAHVLLAHKNKQTHAHELYARHKLR
jgi:hypothetical protein